MAFNPDRCYIPTVYCGKQARVYPYVENENRYIGPGDSYQCMQKGYGAAQARENRKRLTVTSLQNIRYVGPKFEENFRREGISTIAQLISYVRNHTVAQSQSMLERVFRNANGRLNGKGFNSTLLYLYKNGNDRLPQCVDIE